MINRFEQFSASIASIHKNIQKIKRDEMAKYKLKGPHVQCMVIMARHPEGITLSQLCEKCELDKAAISRSVSELEEKGMIERVHSGDKTYRAPLKLTPSGYDTALEISKTAENAVALAGIGLNDADRRIFYQTLDLIAANLRRISREGVKQKEARNG